MSLNVLYDDRGFRMEVGGVARCFAETIKRLPSDVKWQVAARYTENVYLRNDPYNVPQEREFTRQMFVDKFLGGHYVHGLDRLWGFFHRRAPQLIRACHELNDRYLYELSRRERFDVIHLTEPHCFDYDWKRVVRDRPLVVTVHDLIPDLRSDVKWFGERRRNCRREVLDRADAIVAVSNYTKQKLVAAYSVNASKITVIHHGRLDFEGQDLSPVFDRKKYILYVGKRDTYKQFNFFVKAIAPMLLERDDLYLACTGSSFSDEEESLLRVLNVRQKVLQAFVHERQMKSLYCHAEAFVYPSLEEGFGIPILDAFSAGCPVVLANASCFPEVAGDAALYFEPHDAEDLRSKVEQLLGEKSLRVNMIQRGFERVGQFTWERASCALSDVYRSLV